MKSGPTKGKMSHIESEGTRLSSTIIQHPPFNMTNNTHVVVVGGGVAGLMAARELLKSDNSDLTVTLVEQADRLGGRIRAADTPSGGPVIDLGAEFIHGKGTMLTDLVEELFGNDATEEIFITCHADGGPSSAPTKNGKYGMYFCGGELMMYDDERIWPLTRALGQLQGEKHDPTASVGQVLRDHQLSPELISLAEASFGNTVGAHHDDVSSSVLAHFDNHWYSHEEEGDLRLNPKIGMYGCVKKMAEELAQDERFVLKMNWSVDKIVHDDSTVRLTSADNDVLEANALIITVPPPAYSSIDMDLGPERREALTHIGMNTAMKLLLKFKNPIWPPNVQSVICGDCPVPEMWFKQSGDYYLATGYLTSHNANAFLEICGNDQEKAGSIMLEQMVKLFGISSENIQLLDSHMHVWEYGYMYPKVNMTVDHLHAMAAPIQDKIFFAGEATNTNACCTVQAAVETGARAAQEVLNVLQSPDDYHLQRVAAVC